MNDNEECGALGCSGDGQCGECAARSRIGAVARLNPDIANAAKPFVDMAANVFGIPEPFKAGIDTAIGITTPVSEEDIADFAKLVQNWQIIDSALFSPNTPGSLKSRISSSRNAYKAFLDLWNAAQRDPAALRRQLKVADDLLAAVEAAKASGVSSGRGPRIQVGRRRKWGKALTLTVVGAGAVAIGAGAALILGKK